jgi:omega-6 fatty acid desaturase (delta-12 desaturase)
MITYLQHTDPSLPHYSDDLWTFPRGALCTIDRTFFGPVGTWMVHGLCETHVAHHICSKIPHYHAWEATEALKAFLGEHYHRSEENMLVSLWKSHRNCLYVEDDVDVAFYKNHHGQAQRAGIVVQPQDSGVEVSE